MNGKIIAILLLFSTPSLAQKDSSFIFKRIETTLKVINDESFSKENLKKFIKELGITNQKIVYAQAFHETNGFKSKVFRENNNLFGMKVPRKRPTTALNFTKTGYAKYRHWKDSVLDYSYYQQYKNIEKFTEKEYLAYIQKKYAEDKKYLQKVLKFVND